MTSYDIHACTACTDKYGYEPPKLVSSHGAWHVSCPHCLKRSPAYLDRSFAVRAWNRGDRKNG